MLLTGEHFLELVKKNKKLSETILWELKSIFGIIQMNWVNF